MIKGNISATKVLLKEVIKAEKRTAAGLIVPVIGKELQITGEIIQIGSGTSSIPMEAKVGEHVLFYPNAAQRFHIEDDLVMLLDARDILFRFKPDV